MGQQQGRDDPSAGVIEPCHALADSFQLAELSLTTQSFQLAASKMDKVSGDIRVCFEILRNTVTKKIDSLRPFLPQESSSLNFHDSRITLDAADL